MTEKLLWLGVAIISTEIFAVWLFIELCCGDQIVLFWRFYNLIEQSWHEINLPLTKIHKMQMKQNNAT